MLYEAYEKKIRKRYKRFNTIYRFRILLSAITLFMVLLTTSFFVTKGMVFSLDFDNEINYGEEIKLSSTSFLSNQEYYYKAKEATTWDNNEPTIPGDYEVKIVTKGVFSKREKVLPLTIKEKDVSLLINKDEVEFGDHPFEIEDFEKELVFGDYIDYFEYDYKDPSKKKTEISLSSIIINNKNHEDVTRFYNINSNKKEVEFVQRKIEIELESNSFIYDGNNKTSNDFKITSGSLVSGHYIELTSKADIFNVSRVKNDIDEIFIYDEEGLDVTVNYLITRVDENSYLEITERDLDLELADAEKSYDSTPLVSDELVTPSELELLDGHTVKVTSKDSITNYGTTLNNIDTVIILDLEGNDVTNNYNIKKIAGELKINKHIIEIKTKSARKIYDGLSFENTGFDILSGKIFNDGEYFELLNNVKETNVGIYENIVTYRVKDANGNISENYLIDHSYGELEITSRDFTLEINSDEKIYDGKYLNNLGFDVEGLANTHEISITNKKSFDKYFEVGEYSNEFDYIIIDKDGNDVSSNYTIETIYGLLKISKRELSIQTNTKSNTYDGYILEDTSINILNETSLSSTDLIEVTDYPRILNVQKVTNEVLFIINHSEFLIDVTSNYDITYDYGILEITLRAITIKNGDYHKVYDGNELVADLLHEVTLGTLANNEVITAFETTGSITDVDEEVSTIIKGSVIIENNNGLDVSSNYEITLESGMLIVTPREITVKPKDKEKVYDGTKLFNETNEYEYSINSKYELVKGHTIEIFTSGKITNYQDEPLINEITSHHIDGSDDYDLNLNYEVNYETGTLNIVKRKITIETANDSKVYDGLEHFNENHEVISDNKLVLNDYTVVTSKTTITNVGDKDNILTVDIYTKDGEPNNINYNITYVYNTISITKREITIKPTNKDKVYDGNYLFNELTEFDYSNNSKYKLVEGHNINIYTDSSIIDVEDNPTVNSITSHHVFSDDDSYDLNLNYEVIYETGTLQISKRYITVKTADDSKDYDSKYFYNDELTDLYDQIVAGDYFVITNTDHHSKYINVGEYKNTLIYEIRNINGVDVTNNYEISDVIGELTINIINLTVSTNSHTKVYDGEVLSDSSIYFDGLVDNDYYEITSRIPDITNVGDIENSIDFILRRKLNDEEVLKNYDIEYKYGRLEVTKRTIHIKPEDIEVIYDGTEVSPNGFVYASSSPYEIVENELMTYTLNGKAINAGFYEKISSINSVKILNKHNQSSTDNYDIVIFEGNINILKRIVNIRPIFVSKEYDGIELTSNKYDYISDLMLVLDHYFELEMSGAITNVGRDINSFDNVMIFNKAGIDETDNYDITNIYNEFDYLEITPREIVIITADDEKIYDGDHLASQEYIIEDNKKLALDDKISIESSSEITNVGTKSNEFVVSILTGDNVNNDYNYNITFIEGILEVYKREITVKPTNKEKVYDGTELFNEKEESQIIFGNLVKDHKIEITTNGKISNYQDEPMVNEITGHHIDGSEDYDLNLNYEVTYETGTLNIIKRKITIETANDSKVYDGKYFFNDSYEITDSLIIDQGLADGQQIVITNDNHKTAYYKFGEYKNKFDFKITLNDLDTTDNYEIDITYGQLTIEKKLLEYKTQSDTKVYDGNLLFLNEIIYLNDNKLADTDMLFNLLYSSILNVGNITNEVSFEIFNNDQNEVSTDNYIIENISNGTLEITEKEITIVLEDAEKVYDGTELVSKSWVYGTFDELVQGEIISFETDGSQTIVGTSKNNIIESSIKVLKANNEVSTKNYIINRVSADLTVLENKITIVLIDDEKVYDGLALTNNQDFEIVSDDPKYGLIKGHTITIETTGEITNVGFIINTLASFSIKDIDGNDVSENYTVNSINSKLTITKRVFKIISKSDTHEYDANIFSNEMYDQVEGTLALGDNIQLLSLFKGAINVGKYENDNEYTILRYGIDNTFNYEFTVFTGELVITQRNITITSNNYTNRYNKEAHYFNSSFISKGTLANNHTYNSISSHEDYINVGTYANKLEYTILDKNNNDVSYNYKILNVEGTIEITKKNLYLKEFSLEFIYSDQFNIGNRRIEQNEFIISFNIRASNKVVGRYYYETGFTIGNISVLDAELSEDVTSNYNLIFNSDSYIEIIEKELTLTAKNDLKPYDGTPLINNEIISEGLINNHRVVTINNSSITEVGQIANKISAHTIFDENNIDVTSNYKVTYMDGVLEVIPLPLIKFKAKDVSFTYNGKAQSSSVVQIILGSLVDGHRIEFLTYSKLTDVGNITIIIEEYIILDENGEDVTLNYEVDYEDTGNLTITPAKITIETATDSSHTYNALAYKNDGYKLIDGILYNNEDIIVENSYLVTNAGKTPNRTSFKVVLDGEESNNYEIDYISGTITIKQREVTLETFSKTFDYTGDVQNYLEYNKDLLLLLENHKVDSVTSNTNERNVGIYDNKLNIRIVDKYSDEDVTSNYKINNMFGTITINKINLSIDKIKIAKEYDGSNVFKGITFNMFDSNGIDLTVNLDVKVNSENAGSYYEFISENLLITDDYEFKVNNVTNNYLIEFNKDNEIVIHKRVITIKPKDLTKEYNGKYQGIEKTDWAYSSNPRLIEGHQITINTIGQVRDVYEGDIKTTITSHEIFGNGIDQSNNYDVYYDTGYINIKPLDINLKTETDSIIYNANYFYNTNVSVDFGKYNDQLIVKDDLYFRSFLDVGTYQNKFNYILRGNDGRDVSENYNIITEEWGTLTIVKRDLIIETEDYTKVYDGSFISYPELSFIEGTNIADGLMGDSFEIDSYTEEINVGEYDNVISIRIFSDKERYNSDDLSENYNIVYRTSNGDEYGKITILRREIHIKARDKEKEYDGKELVTNLDEFEYLISSPYNIVFGQIIEVFARPNVPAIKVGEYNNYIREVSIYYNGEDVSDNYNIKHHIEDDLETKDYQVGILKINKAILYLDTVSDWHIYDSNYFYNDSHILHNSNKLVEGDRIIAKDGLYKKEYINAGVYTNNLIEFEVVNNEDSEVGNNYEIIIVAYGTITIEKLEVELKINDIELIYNGKEQNSKEFDLYHYGSLTNLPYNDSYEILNINSFINVGIYDNKFIIRIEGHDNRGNVTDKNYIINYEYGELSIVAREVYIKLEDKSKVYDREELTSKDYEYVYEDKIFKLVDGETIIFDTDGSQTEIGKSDNYIIESSVNVLKANNEDSTDNYKLYFEKGTLEVTKIDIVIKAENSSKEYDGKVLKHNKLVIDTVKNNLLDGHILVGQTYGEITLVGKAINNILSYDIIDELSGESVLRDYYDEEVENGTLTVIERNIFIKAKDNYKPYDGTPLTSNEAVDIEAKLLPGHYIVMETEGSIIYPGRIYNNIVDGSINIYDENSNNVTNLYNPYFDNSGTKDTGTLIVTSEIIIQIYQNSYTYDGSNKMFNNTDFYYPFQGGRLPNGYKLTLEIEGEIKNVGRVDSKTSEFIISDSFGNTENEHGESYADFYHIKVIEGFIQINSRKLIVMTESSSKLYDGLELFRNNFTYLFGELAKYDYEYVSFELDSMIKEVGFVENKIYLFEIWSDSNELLYSNQVDRDDYNYDVTFIWGTLRILPNPDLLYLEERNLNKL